MTYAVLHGHSYHSLLDGVSSPKEIAKRCKEVGVTRAALSDHGNVFGYTDWYYAAKDAGILPLCGIEFYVCQELSTSDKNRKNTHLILIAKNTAGYKQLVKMISRSNSNDCFYYKNRLSLEEIADYLDGNIIGICGHMGSCLGEVIIEEEKNEKGRGTGKWHLKDDWKEQGTRLIQWFQKTFGQDNFGVEIQTYEGNRSGFRELIECNRELCKITGATPVASADNHYAYQHQAELQRILLCVQMNTTLERVREEGELSIFFDSDKLYLPSRQELKEWGNTDEELDNTLKITENCEELEVFSPPRIPSASIADGYKSSIDYLSFLCKDGYKKRFPHNTMEYAQRVGERCKTELEVINECGLTDYFLLIYKIVQWCKSQNILTNIRGSATGCMVNYLLGISNNDPIKYGLLFERFFNAGRVVVKEDGTKVYNLPDVDIDVQASQRHRIIQWLAEEYGEDNVGRIVAFGTLKGRGALKGVCKALGTVPEAEANKITALMPEEHIIDDDLRALAEDFGYRSIIQYCLLNMGNTFAAYAKLNNDNSISGPLANEFTIARSLEGIPKTASVHAAGIIINTGDTTLADSVPMCHTNISDKVVAISMDDIEKYGCIKLDLLNGIELDHIKTAIDFINTGEYKIHTKPKEEQNNE